LCEAKTSVLGTLDILKPREDNDVQFLYALLSNIHFEKYITGSTIPHIYFRDYSKEKVKIPKLLEQQKISAFLSTIDNIINANDLQLSYSSQFKQGLLQKIFV